MRMVASRRSIGDAAPSGGTWSAMTADSVGQSRVRPYFQALVRTTATGQVLLYRHHRREREHPAETPRSDDEHQQHQRPAAADAEQAVIEAELEGLAAR